MKNKTILIISCSSYIGNYIAKRYIHCNNIIGSFRTHTKEVSQLENIGISIYELNLESDNSITELSRVIPEWDVCYFCVGEPLPVGGFFETDFFDWERSVQINSILQLKLLHNIINKANNDASVVFFGSGGVNKSITDFSAYTVGTAILCKSVELIAEENPDYRFFVFGPGWVYSKIHDRIYNNLQNDSEWKRKTYDMIQTGVEIHKYEQIVNKLESLIKKPVNMVSGKNFCISDDIDDLQIDDDMYKFRRTE